jgi:2-desacetyl-2-hydroxyethyl bacteriochlorophyllide A dehydrogenase
VSSSASRATCYFAVHSSYLNTGPLGTGKLPGALADEFANSIKGGDTQVVTAQIVVCQGPGQVALEARALPAPGPNQVLIRGHVSLVSVGTELTTVRGEWPEGAFWRRITRYPGDLGYSLVGCVEAVGAGTTAFAIGDRVVANAPHGSAALLTLQRPPTERPNVIPIPPEVDDEAAAFLALALVALNGVRLARIELGDTVAVVGLGVIGQFCCRFARLAGAGRVIGLGHRPGHLAAARAGGVTVAEDPRKAEPLALVRAHNRGELADVVLESSGSPSAIDLALHLARRQGRVVLAGSPSGAVNLELHETVHGQGLQLIGAHISTLPFGELPLQSGWSVERTARLYWDLLADGAIAIAPLISDRVPGHAAPALYERLLADRGDALGVILDWTGEAAD